ncbi:MAG: tetratricopeptide repeat protein [Gammaproteobacteria bacterium]|nr:tetratricopeptide repeat protein [Gammaproteobacteria bacterium]
MNPSPEQNPYIIEVTPENIQQAVLEGSSTVPVLLDIWADWCEPCKVLTPILENLVELYAGRFLLAKLDAQAQEELASQLGVQSLPALKLIVDGQIVGELSGVQPVGVIRELLDQHVEPDAAPSETPEDSIRTAIESGDLSAAQQLLSDALTAYPADRTYKYLAIELYMAGQELAAAKERFEGLSDFEKDTEEGKCLEARFYFAAILDDAPADTDYAKQLENSPDDADALYYLAAIMAEALRFDDVLDLAWRLFQSHRSYRSGESKTVLLKTFDLMGKTDARSQTFRRKMFNLLH